MAEEYRIVVKIGKDGVLQATVLGIEGLACGEVSKWLDSMGDVLLDAPTEDMQLEESVRESQTIKTSY